MSGCIIVHGGAGSVPAHLTEKKIRGCQLAVQAGYSILCTNGSALDAVETAVRSLEDNPSFNAGHGSVFNNKGQIEMDAMIMEGAQLGVGAVAGVKTVANPVSLARKVMECTDHVMLISEGAELFAREQGIPEVSSEDLVSPQAKSRWEDYVKYNVVVQDVFNKPEDSNDHDTVGAVAMDRHGNIACATSTGGTSMKRVGRVGDVPIVGCGGYSDNSLGGVSCTGHGESITRVTLAHRVLSNSLTMSGQNAVEQSLKFMWDKVKGHGGLIMITPNGVISKGFTTKTMTWASIDSNGILETGIDQPAISTN